MSMNEDAVRAVLSAYFDGASFRNVPPRCIAALSRFDLEYGNKKIEAELATRATTSAGPAQDADRLLRRASAMADALGDESWKQWSQTQAHDVEQALDDLRSLAEKLGSECNRQIRANGEMRVVLGALLNLFDPPGEAKRRHHAEDENGFWMSVGGAVTIGRQLIPKPLVCRMCRGGGADEYGAECSDCDGEGYDAKSPITDAERRVWAAIAQNVTERAKKQ